ncbi:MAG: Ig-like domain-containing protein [Candidatus Levyibacteriota bacterium]
MSYKPSYLTTKRLPNYAGFLVLLVALGITIVLSKNNFNFVSKATIGSEPKNIQVSNLSDSSFTVSYTTDAAALGIIAYGSDPATANVALDARDQQTGKALEHQVHFMTIKNLSPSTTYYYIIQSGDQKAEDNGKPFEIVTPASLSAQSTNTTTLSGTVATTDGNVPSEGIVYLSTDGSEQMAALLNPDGSYNIPLATMRNADLSQSQILDPESILQLHAANDTEQSEVKLLASQASQVPKIVLSQNYDFTLSPDPISSESAAIASQSGLPAFSTPAPASAPEITSPKDSQAYKTQQPTFSGRSLPNQEVDVTIHSQQEISAKLQSDSQGSWTFRPPVTLDPGKHSIAVTSLDASGVLQTISKSFTVYAAGSQFVEPSVSPIASPSAIASASPTLAPSPTIDPTPSPTATPSPTLAATPTIASPAATVPPARGAMPPTGSSAIVTGLLAVVTTMGIGALLFIFTAI